MAKAILLLSGGLDSVLAGKMLLEMGVEVEAVTFTTPFCQCQGAARTAAEQLGVPVRIVECQQNYLETMKHPKFGFGANANACIDCHLFFLRQAKVLMEAEGVDFLATGEVLGERPMATSSTSAAIRSSFPP